MDAVDKNEEEDMASEIAAVEAARKDADGGKKDRSSHSLGEGCCCSIEIYWDCSHPCKRDAWKPQGALRRSLHLPPQPPSLIPFVCSLVVAKTVQVHIIADF